MRKVRRIDNLLDTTCILVEKWLKSNQILQRKCEVVILEIEGRRKRVNIATITGASIGIFGAVVAGVGLLLAPLTAGISTVLSVGGGVLAISGGGITTGAKFVELKLNHGTKDALKRYHNCHEERYTSLMAIIDQLEKEIEGLEKISAKIFWISNHSWSCPSCGGGDNGSAKSACIHKRNKCSRRNHWTSVGLY